MQFFASFFDGLCGSVIGIIAVIAAQILKASIQGTEGENPSINKVAQTGSAAVLYLLAFVSLYKLTSKYAALLIIIFGAVAGQFIFVD
jgi:chromate transport protein ChrA